MGREASEVLWKSLSKKKGATDNEKQVIFFTPADITLHVQGFTPDQNTFDVLWDSSGVYKFTILAVGLCSLGISAYALFNVGKVFDFFSEVEQKLAEHDGSCAATVYSRAGV